MEINKLKIIPTPRNTLSNMLAIPNKQTPQTTGTLFVDNLSNETICLLLKCYILHHFQCSKFGLYSTAERIELRGGGIRGDLGDVGDVAPSGGDTSVATVGATAASGKEVAGSMNDAAVTEPRRAGIRGDDDPSLQPAV